MKLCGRCEETLDESKFFKRKLPSGNYTLQVWCKECSKKNGREWRKTKRATDPEWSKNEDAKVRKYKQDHPDFYAKILENNRVRSKAHYYRNKERYLESSVRRKHAVGCSTPKWLSSSQKEQIVTIYRDCRIVSENTGVIHHVDHIVPLRGEKICGLHVPWNLEIVTAQYNLSKGNSYNG